MPNDMIQAAAQTRVQLQSGCHRTYVLDDGEVDGNDAAQSFQVAAKRAHLTVVASDQYDPKASNYTSLVHTVVKSGADCVLISALPQEHAAALTEQIGQAMPRAKLFGTAGLAEQAYIDPVHGGLPTALGDRMLLTLATLRIGDYPPAGRRFFSVYARRYGGWQPDAIYGYDAMSLLLTAIARATGDGTRPAERSAVTRELFGTRDRDSVLGTYSIDRLGDTSLDHWGVYRIRDGRLVFDEALTG
jgi:branched-chain amino acid transport system substrate-binding protein